MGKNSNDRNSSYGFTTSSVVSLDILVPTDNLLVASLASCLMRMQLDAYWYKSSVVPICNRQKGLQHLRLKAGATIFKIHTSSLEKKVENRKLAKLAKQDDLSQNHNCLVDCVVFFNECVCIFYLCYFM